MARGSGSWKVHIPEVRIEGSQLSTLGHLLLKFCVVIQPFRFPRAFRELPFSIILVLSCCVICTIRSCPLLRCRWSRVCRFGNSCFPPRHSNSSKCTRQPEFWTDVHSGVFFFYIRKFASLQNLSRGEERFLQIARATDACNLRTARHGKRLKLTDLTDSD